MFRVDDLSHVFSQGLFARIAHHSFGGFIEVENIPLEIGNIDHVVRVLEQLAIALFACLQRLLGPFALGNVVNDGKSADHLPGPFRLASRVADRRVVGLVESLAALFQHTVRPVSGDDALAVERLEKELVFSGFFQKREDLERASANRFVFADPEEAFQGRIPDRVAALTVKREDAVWTTIDQPFIDGSQLGIGSE